ncbi:AsmA family protein [Legionella micdadei]|uniref:AsmA family protein n=1 Tax=Legionella micdadei TaxID=451 RepID=UPI0009EF7F50|nr:AsmA family protein [Legionella micdadei]ARG99882.1 hypothetical protein B6V88_05325 [Legionella micdadei]
MKILKRLLAGTLITLVIATIALWTLAKTINPEIVKDYVSAQLSTLTQQESKVNGEISWQIFPRPGIRITQIQIGNEDNQANYSAKLENLLFNLKITPLLRGKLVFNELNVDGFKIHINPEALSPSLKSVRLKGKNEEKTSLADQFAIERFLLSHGQIVIQENQKLVTLSGLQIGAEQFNFQRTAFPLQFKTTLEVNAAKEKLFKTHINFKGRTSLAPSLFSNPLIALQNMPLDGQLSLQNTKLKHFKVTKISARTKTKPGVLLLNPLTFDLYNGESVGDLHYEFASKKLILNQTATNLDSAKLGHDLFNKILFKGSLDFSIHAQANLQNPNWQDSFNGRGNLTIKEGTMEAINLDKVIEGTSNKVNTLLLTKKTNNGQQILELGQFNNPEFFKGSTNFKLLTFQYLLQNEKLTSNSLVLQTDKLQLKGEGNLDLRNNDIDGRLLAKVVLQDSQIDKIQQLLGGGFPILIKGTLTEPTVLPDLQKINPVLTQAWIQDTLTKPVKKLEETVKTILTTVKPPAL